MINVIKKMVGVQAEKRQRQIEAAERAKRAAAEAQRNLELFRQQNNMGPSPTPDAEPNASAAASGVDAQVQQHAAVPLANVFHMFASVAKRESHNVKGRRPG